MRRLSRARTLDEKENASVAVVAKPDVATKGEVVAKIERTGNRFTIRYACEGFNKMYVIARVTFASLRSPISDFGMRISDYCKELIYNNLHTYYIIGYKQRVFSHFNSAICNPQCLSCFSVFLLDTPISTLRYRFPHIFNSE